MEQTYKTHQRIVPMYHYVTFLILVAVTIGSFVNLYEATGRGAGVYSASLISALSVASIFIFFFTRVFALKAQDRAIRAEENLRHFAMNGKLLDPRLSIRQIIGLRFASDEEFLDLEAKAVKESLSEGDIKKAIKKWRPDTYRV